MVSHATADIFLKDDGFVWVKFKEKAELTEEVAYEFIKIFDEVCGNQKRGFILETRGSRATTTKEFRKVIGNHPDALKWRKADAILLNSLHKRLVGNFYMKFETPNLPVGLFGTEEAAKGWLKQF
jgi:hypothetical protein